MPKANARTRAFEPHHLRAMLGAFDAVCTQLRLPTHEGSGARKRVASLIFDLAITGETDEKGLVSQVLAEFRRPGAASQGASLPIN
jgi:DNA-binding transcriptional LysR family regulator